MCSLIASCLEIKCTSPDFVASRRTRVGWLPRTESRRLNVLWSRLRDRTALEDLDHDVDQDQSDEGHAGDHQSFLQNLLLAIHQKLLWDAG